MTIYSSHAPHQGRFPNRHEALTTSQPKDIIIARQLGISLTPGDSVPWSILWRIPESQQLSQCVQWDWAGTHHSALVLRDWPFRSGLLMMKFILLVVANIASSIGLLLMVLFSFPNLAFSLDDALIYGALAALSLAIIMIAGRSLNRQFTNNVTSVIERRPENPTGSIGGLACFNLLCISLLPTLIFVYFYGFYLVIEVCLLIVSFILTLPRIPLVIPIGIALLFLGTLVGMLIGLYYLCFPPTTKSFGILIHSHMEPNLYAISREVANQARTRAVEQIYLCPRPRIGVYETGNLLSRLSGFGKRVLEVGIPSLYELTEEEFRAILMHEYGHFSNQDTRRGSFTHAIGMSLASAIRAMPGPSTSGESKGFISVLFSLNPAYYIVALYLVLYAQTTSGFSRFRELLADRRAILTYGSHAFYQGLLKVASNDLVFHRLIEPECMVAAAKGRSIPNLADYIDERHQNFSEDDFNVLKPEWTALTQSTSVRGFDSHPPLRLRLDYARALSVASSNFERPVQSIFTNWQALTTSATGLYQSLLAQVASAGASTTGVA